MSRWLAVHDVGLDVRVGAIDPLLDLVEVTINGTVTGHRLTGSFPESRAATKRATVLGSQPSRRARGMVALG